jgi:hypothetical protein
VNRRPLSITIVAAIYIAAGTVGLVYHLSELDRQHPFANDVPWVSLVRVLAIVAGIFMLRGANWARWLALAWIAFHVVVSAFHSLPELAMHSVICAVLAYFLFRPTAARYFRP